MTDFTSYGTVPLGEGEIKLKGQLSNGSWYVAGFNEQDGVCVDVYEDEALTRLLFMEHGISLFEYEDDSQWAMYEEQLIKVVEDRFLDEPSDDESDLF